MGNPEPNPFFRKQTKVQKNKDRCRDSMEAILTNGVKYVGKGIFTSKFQKEKE